MSAIPKECRLRHKHSTTTAAHMCDRGSSYLLSWFGVRDCDRVPEEVGAAVDTINEFGKRWSKAVQNCERCRIRKTLCGSHCDHDKWDGLCDECVPNEVGGVGGAGGESNPQRDATGHAGASQPAADAADRHFGVLNEEQHERDLHALGKCGGPNACSFCSDEDSEGLSLSGPTFGGGCL